MRVASIVREPVRLSPVIAARFRGSRSGMLHDAQLSLVGDLAERRACNGR